MNNTTSSREQRILLSKRQEQQHTQSCDLNHPRKKKRGGIKQKEKVMKYAPQIPLTDAVAIQEMEREIDDEDTEEVNMMEGLITTTSNPITETITPQMNLPAWLQTPTLISSSLTQTPSSLSTLQILNKTLQDHLKEQGVTHLFPVQETLLRLLTHTQNARFKTSDVYVKAPTGSGKTLAYVLPLLNALTPRLLPRLRALILVPTKDLCNQVKSNFLLYAQKSPLLIKAFGGKFSEEGEGECDILITTPGRLCDHVKHGLALCHLRYLVIDEADRLFSQTYQNWVHVVLDAVQGKERCVEYKGGIPLQKLLFSATLDHCPKMLGALKLERPLYVCVDDQGERVSGPLTVLPDTLKEEMVITTMKNKLAAVCFLLMREECDKMLVFTKSVAAAHRLAAFLRIHLKKLSREDGVEAVTSLLGTQQRKAIFKSFGDGVRILVCSDVLSRGVDLEVGCVVQYDCPTRVETYVHRCGRTARAGNIGKAITILEKKGVRHFKQVLRECKRSGKVEKRELGEEVIQVGKGVVESLKELEALVKGGKVDHVAEDMSGECEEYNVNEYDVYYQ